MIRIPLIKNAFLEEEKTRKALAEFIVQAPRYSMDKQCLNFEKAFSKFQQTTNSVLFNSGGSHLSSLTRNRQQPAPGPAASRAKPPSRLPRPCAPPRPGRRGTPTRRSGARGGRRGEPTSWSDSRRRESRRRGWRGAQLRRTCGAA